ncbi:hypothetical protein NLX62_08220, partial [Mycobacteriaceae bacterium Msp059]|nr:hypothetical protein [Mycobacteriaceae bacterium Msp059]
EDVDRGGLLVVCATGVPVVVLHPADNTAADTTLTVTPTTPLSEPIPDPTTGRGRSESEILQRRPSRAKRLNDIGRCHILARHVFAAA